MKNILVFVADSLRYDYVPASIGHAGTLIKTLAPSLYTSTSFASLITARSPEHHNVRSFFDALNHHVPTVFDLFPYGSYYDHPVDPMCTIVLRNCPQPTELTAMKEPFVWIERALDTHIPYAKITHGNDIFSDYIQQSGKAYIKALARGEINRYEEYVKGVKSVEAHFWKHVNELKTMDVYENTLIIFTSDHGELLGEHWVGDVHNYPPCQELIEVPTVFLNTKIDYDFMRTIDIIPTALGIVNHESSIQWDGKDIRKHKPTRGANATQNTFTWWSYNEGNQQITLQKYYKKITSKRNLWIPIPITLAHLSRKINPLKTKSTFLL